VAHAPSASRRNSQPACPLIRTLPRRTAVMPTMTRLDRAAVARFLAAASLACACAGAAAEPAQKVTTVKVAGHALRVEIAATDPQREKGLMFRREMPRNDGMLFVFD